MIHYTRNLKSISSEMLQGFFAGWPSPPSPTTHLKLFRQSDKIILSIEDNNSRVVGFITAISDRILTAHDLVVNYFRIDVILAAHKSRSLTLQRWVPESEFWSFPDTVEYKTANGKSKKRKVIPDGFFTVRQPHVSQPGMMEELAFLLEIDMGTEDNPRFAREKVRPGVAYLKSEDYQARFGVNYGRWLVVTTGKTRLANMKDQTEHSGGSQLFHFTTMTQVSPETVLTGPIWYVAGSDETSSVVPQLRWTAP